MKRSAVAAMGIAIVGAATSAVAFAELALSPATCSVSACTQRGLILALYSAALVVVNMFLMVGMLRGSHKAWTIALVLVVTGAIADVVLRVTGGGWWMFVVSAGAIDLLQNVDLLFHLSQYSNGWYVNTLMMDTTYGLPYNWTLVHLVVIQLPILMLLWAGRPLRKAASAPGQREVRNPG